MEDPPQLRGGGGVHIKKMNGPLEGVENSVHFRGATRFFARSEDGEFPMFHNDFMFCQSATWLHCPCHHSNTSLTEISNNLKLILKIIHNRKYSNLLIINFAWKPSLISHSNGMLIWKLENWFNAFILWFIHRLMKKYKFFEFEVCLILCGIIAPPFSQSHWCFTYMWLTTYSCPLSVKSWEKIYKYWGKVHTKTCKKTFDHECS